MGHAAILDLFDELADMVESGIGFANVMEDCYVERSILRDLRIKQQQQQQQQLIIVNENGVDRDDRLRVAIIGSAGCTALSLLADGPLKLDIVDANPSQLGLVSSKACLVAACVHMYGSRGSEAASAAYLRFLRGQATAEELKELKDAESSLASIKQRSSSLSSLALDPSPLGLIINHQGVTGGLCGDGKYESIFRKLAALRQAGASEAEAFASALDDATTDRRFNGRVAHHCCKTLAEGFRELIGWEHPDKGCAAACKGGRSPYFQALIDGRSCDPLTPSPPYASRLLDVAAGMAASDLGLHATGMAEFLEGQVSLALNDAGAPSVQYDMIQVSNVTDWMSTEEAARLLKACRSVYHLAPCHVMNEMLFKLMV